MVRITAFLLLLPFLLSAQRSAPAPLPVEDVDLLLLPPLDNEALLAAEQARWRPGLAPRFAEALEVAVTPDSHGNWEQLPGGDWVWRLRIRSPGAHSLNLGFARYRMPAGGTLLLYSEDRERVLGPFTAADNEAHGQLWTPVFDGDALVLELRLPAAGREKLELLLSRVNHDFLGFRRRLSSGDCHLDVNCRSADGWAIVDPYADVIRSVALYGFGGDSFCSGFLINNAREDCTPYFLTAYHCGVDADNDASVVVYWNYENSRCRPPGAANNGSAGDGPLDDVNRGAVLRAGYAASDFMLLELEEPVSRSAGAYFAGWSAAAALPGDTLACVHHPGSNEKRISFSFAQTYRGEWGRGAEAVADGDHLVVPAWDIGATEVGSSGAPLFDRQRRAVGQLHGGLAACDNRLHDQFGWLHRSWEGGGTPATSLRPWLDPDATGRTALDGRPAAACESFITVAAPARQVCGVDTLQYALSVSPQFRDSVRLAFRNLPDPLTAAFSANPAAPGAAVRIVLRGVGQLPAGRYELPLYATDGRVAAEPVLLLITADGPPPPLQALLPADGETAVAPFTPLTWSAAGPGALYRLELALDSAFRAPVVVDAALPGNSRPATRLAPATRYFWRVQARNACGAGPRSPTFSFTTAAVRCDTAAAGDLPHPIDPRGAPLVESILRIDTPGTVVGLYIPELLIRHSYVGDLKATLVAPDGRRLPLFDRPGYPGRPFGCEGSDLELTFSDTAPNSAEQLEAACDDAPAARGRYRPLGAFRDLLGTAAAGDWTLQIKDHSNQDGGSLERWSLALCIAAPKDRRFAVSADSIAACSDGRPTFQFRLGRDFLAPRLRYAVTPPAPLRLQLDADSAALPTDRPVTVTVEGAENASGRYDLALRIVDGSYEAVHTVALDLTAPPAPPRPTAPPDAATLGTPTPRLAWEAGPAAENYHLEVARDDAFRDTLPTISLADTAYRPAAPLAPGRYYWRVTARNHCGAATGAARSFTIQSSAVGRLGARRVQLFPNPVRDRLFIEVDGTLPGPPLVELYSIDGRRLLRRSCERRGAMWTLSLAALPPGVYVVRISNDGKQWTGRVVRQ